MYLWKWPRTATYHPRHGYWTASNTIGPTCQTSLARKLTVASEMALPSFRTWGGSPYILFPFLVLWGIYTIRLTLPGAFGRISLVMFSTLASLSATANGSGALQIVWAAIGATDSMAEAKALVDRRPATSRGLQHRSST